MGRRERPLSPARKRHGTATLFAAREIATGKVISQNMQRHRHQEFIRFLNTVNRSIPPDKPVHVVLDNYATHKHSKALAWLARHPNWTFHFTPGPPGSASSGRGSHRPTWLASCD